MYTLNTIDRPAVFAYRKTGHARTKEDTQGYQETDTVDTLNTSDNTEARTPTLIYDARGNGDGETVPTITGDHQNRITDYTAICIGNGQSNIASHITEEVCQTLDCMHDQKAVMTVPTDNPIRRLTPLEAERCQGLPSKAEPLLEEMTTDEYISWNIIERNVIVDSEKGIVYGTRGPGGKLYKKPIELKGTIINGYKSISIRNGNIKRPCRVNRIVWISRNGIIPEGYCVDHINNNKLDNRIANLQLLTTEENSKKAHKDGLYKVKENAGTAKLSNIDHDVIQILYRHGLIGWREAANMFGICKSRFYQIIHEEGWTDIGDWTDSKGKKHKTTDSNRFRAIGNGIALPFWHWLLKRIGDHCEEKTMGSLFSGIGSFDLIWQSINGEGSVKWCSEIEPFCVAVLKKHFGDEETGEKGDWQEYIKTHGGD